MHEDHEEDNGVVLVPPEVVVPGQRQGAGGSFLLVDTRTWAAWFLGFSELIGSECPVLSMFRLLFMPVRE